MREIPRWGRVTANANEFLIQMRRGNVVRSGQGLSCFKWPWDSVAIVPTSIAKLSFAADQVTTEKVGVEVRGLAVYRIADPLLAFRMIEIDRSTLTEILRDMFVGATRTMPDVAKAFRGSFDRINLTSTNGSEMLGFLSAALDQVLAVARDKGATPKR